MSVTQPTPDGSASTATSRGLREAARGLLASRLPARFLEEHAILPLSEDEAGRVVLAAGAPLDPIIAAELAKLFGRPLHIVSVPAAEIQAALLGADERDGAGAAADGSSTFGGALSQLDALGALGNGGDVEALDDLRALANQEPVIRLVNVLLLDALRAGASDVHVEPDARGVRVRYRLDGVLHDVQRLTRPYQPAVASRIKVMAGLDIAERRRAQDGRARVRLADREVDLRVSTLPALHGESIVVRLLDGGTGVRDLAELGMPADVRDRFERLLRRPSGVVLVTGPTGSGKTTTLYAALARLASPGVKVVTVEDPVEYQMDGIVQLPVNPKAGFGFPAALRSILRHDPDVIMVGETRDRETAEIATQAALTGHLVFSTLHTNDAAGGVTRLLDMGVESFLVAATVQGILAQRLVRVLCDACAQPDSPSDASPAAAPPVPNIENRSTVPTNVRYRRAVGCEECASSGYRGRTGIYELLVLNDALRAQVVAGVSLDGLRAAARAQGMPTLRDEAWRVAREGRTSLEEVWRVTGGLDDEQ